MNLAAIKVQLGISVFNLNTANDSNDKPTNWMRHRDNDNRVAISIHKDTVTAIKDKPDSEALALQHEVRTGAKGDYQAYRIVMYNEEPEATL